MATLVERVRSMSGSTTGLTSNSDIVNLLKSGAKRVINSIPNTMLAPFTTNASITSSTGYAVQNKKVVLVSRANYPCEKLSALDAYAIGNSDSLFYPTARFPKFYELSGVIYIKPDPTTANSGRVDFVNTDTVANDITLNTTTGWKLDPVDHLVITYAAGMDMLNMANYYAEKGTTSLETITSATGDARDALNKAKYLIDASTELSAGQDAEYWLNDEDVEMITGNITIAKQEIDRAMAEMQLNKGKSSGYSGYVSLYVQAGLQLIKEFENGLNAYINNTDEMIISRMVQTAKGGE